MQPLSPSFLLAFAATLAGLALIAWRPQLRSAADFTLAGRAAGPWHVAGAIMGTLVGGASTLGTAQLAFRFGLSAWWFTLGAGLACLLLGLFLAGPLREGEVTTIPEFIARYYGERARVAASLFSAVGMFIHIVAQLLAAGALLSALFGWSPTAAALAAASLVALITLGGGMRGAGPLGLAKLILLYGVMLFAGSRALGLAGGWSTLTGALPAFPWFSLFGYGVGAGLNDLLSMLVGVISTQTYLQAIFAARDRRAARQGALLSALLIPPLGLCGIAVGLAMRLSRPELDSVQALPAFLTLHFPPALAGIAFAALLIAAIVTASGLTLGAGTTLQLDVLARFGRGGTELKRLRLVSLGVLLSALTLLLFNLGSTILQWSFLSMGLRGATLCLPLLAAVFLRGRAPGRAGALAIFLAPVGTVAAGLAGWPPIPPLYPGLGLALFLLLAGFWLEKPDGK
jgi:SSS family solute:Na+ symporter